MRFSKKYRALIKHDAKFDILEGTTYSGKTTVAAGVKFMFEVAKSTKRFHGIAGKDLGTIEKNIINSEKGILAEWGDYVQYRGGGTTDIKLPHIVFRQDDGHIKIIYVFGYDDKARWQKVLGGQLGCVYIDEANIADIDFIREVSIRCDYMCWTLNPDNPDLPIYSEYINHARPIKEYESDYPAELLDQLNREQKAGYTHWYFTFDDNIACTAEKRQQIIGNAPIGTKLYKNKILGLRGVGQGGAYGDFMNRAIHLRKFEDVNFDALININASVDIGSSINTEDAKKSATVLTIGGYSRQYQRAIVLAAYPIPATSYDEIITKSEDILEWYWVHHYGKFKKIIIDSEDPILIRTWRSRTRFKNLSIKGAIKYVKNEITLVTRCQAKQQLIIQERLLWTEKAFNSYHAHELILTDDDGAEMDMATQNNDYADGVTYLVTEEWVSLIEQPKRR